MTGVQLRRLVVDACDGPFGSAIKSDHYVDEGARVIRLGNVGIGEWRDGDKAFLAFDYWRELAGHHACSGDLVMAGLGDERNPVGRACIVPGNIGRALVKADCYRLRVDQSRADVHYLSTFLSSNVGLAQAELLAEGATRQRLTLGKALSVCVPALTLSAQRRIVDYLDAETVRIDSLVAKKRCIIGRLIERRAATTVVAVSGGLTSNAAMKKNSLSWLDEIPVNWDSVLLRLVARLGSGHTPSRDRSDWWVDCTIPWITTGEVSGLRSDRVEYISHTREKISKEGLANSAAELHPKDTVVLCRTASAGYSGMMSTAMSTSQDFATWTCGPRLRPRFLLLCLRAMREDLLGRLAMGSTHKTIYMPDIRSIRIPLPPVEEQDHIVDTAWQILGKIDSLTKRIERQITLLQEHRQALITVAVTGEMEIPGVSG